MIRWEPNNKTKQTIEKLEECYVKHSGIDETNILITYILLVKYYALFLQDQELIMPLLNAVIVISRRVLFLILWKQEYVNSSRGKRRSYIYHIDTEAMIGLVLIIPTNELHDTYHQIWDCDLWGKEFCLY